MASRIVLALALCAFMATASASKVEMKVLSKPQSMKFALGPFDLSSRDAPSTIAHLSGVPALAVLPSRESLKNLPVSSPLNTPVATLTAIVYGTTPSTELGRIIPTYFIDVSVQATVAQQVATLFTGPQSTLLDSIATQQSGSFIVSMSSSSPILESISITPSFANQQHVSLLLDISLREVRLMSLSGEFAEALVAGINAELARAAADETAFGIQELATRALLAAIDARAEFGQDSEVDMVIVSIDGSSSTPSVVSKALRGIADGFSATFGGNALVQAMFMPKEMVTPASTHVMARRALTSGEIILPYVCYATEDELYAATSNCTFHGNSTQAGTVASPCFRCKCSSIYTGDNCQYYDMIAQFSTIVFTSIFLAVVAITVVYALASVDSGTETLLYRTATKPKKTQ